MYNPNSINFKKGHKINVGRKHNKETINKLKEYCGEKHSCWQGGKRDYYRKKAIKVLEKDMGRKIISGEVIHHLDYNYKNNNLNNLHLFSSLSEHSKYHAFLIKIIWEFLDSHISVKEV